MSTETIGPLGGGAQDVHLDFNTAPELWSIMLVFNPPTHHHVLLSCVCMCVNWCACALYWQCVRVILHVVCVCTCARDFVCFEIPKALYKFPIINLSGAVFMWITEQIPGTVTCRNESSSRFNLTCSLPIENCILFLLTPF